MRGQILDLKIFLVFFALLIAVPFARADDPSAGRIIQPMTVLDPITLQANGTRIILWGVKPADAPGLSLKAQDMIERLIGTQPVNCKMISGAAPDIVARCTAFTNEDLGLELINHGYAVLDRRQAGDPVFISTYAAAQKTAHQNGQGVWRLVDQDDKEGAAPQWLQEMLSWGPIGGLLLVALVMHYRLKRMENLQREEQEEAKHKESTLVSREKSVLISTLESELIENKNRIEAFLTIYGDMLRSMKNVDEVPHYKRAGDIIQKHPFLSHTVFDSSVNKLSLLDMKLASQLSKLYLSLPKEQEYINLEASVPLDTALALVEKVLKEAEAMMPAINQMIDALEENAGRKRKMADVAAPAAAAA
jgi:hypothetical protein